MEWIREHFLQLAGGAAALLVLYWLYHNAARALSPRRTKTRGKSYCRQCNWEGYPSKRKRKCGRCGSTDLEAVTH